MSADLTRALQEFGMIVDKPPRTDGTVCRYRMDGKRERAGFVIAKEVNGKYYATYGTWTDRTRDQRWTDNGAGTPHCDLQWAQTDQEAARKRAEAQARAAKVCADMWEQAKPCESHPYLDAKRVQAHGCRVLRGMLLVPFYTPEGAVSTLQRIFPSGKKMLQPDGRISGCCFPIGGNEDRIFICEGFATGATINELTGNKVLVAYSTSNLLPVARSAREKWPKGKIILAADNDHATEGNPGIKAAKAAAEAIGAEVVVPECPPGTDFNDLAQDRPGRAVEILTGNIPKLSVAEIMATDYKPIKWAVSGIIPEGLTILAGRPKFGKSWMMLGLAYAVATGVDAWNFGATTRGTVYYLALEDSPRRIKDRIGAMEGYFDTYPDNLFILTNFPRIGDGFAERMREIIETTPDLGLIIIDTLQKVRPLSGGGKRNLYQAEYEDFEALQKMAISSGVPIIAVHHTRKRSTRGEPSNPIDEISGSTGIQGVADTLIACMRDGNKGEMHVTGREVDEEAYPMEFIRYNMTWKVSSPEEKQIDIGTMILSDWFKSHEAITAKEAADVFGVSLRTSKRKLKSLADSGKLTADTPANPKDPISYKPAEIF